MAALLWSSSMLAADRQGDSWRIFLAVLPCFMFVGYLFGVSLWKSNERRYQEYLNMTPRQKSRKPDALES